MHLLRRNDGSDSSSETRSETGGFEDSASSKQFYKAVVAKANSVPIKNVFKLYNVRIDDYSRKIICPFPHHKNGRESTPSLLLYPQTNSFWCFGCKTGRNGTDLVANMESVSRVKAALKILDLFGSEANLDEIPIEGVDYSERLEILSDFSLFIRNFINDYPDDKDAVVFIERITFIFDKMNSKYSLDNAALKSLADKLKEKGKLYLSCPQL